MLRVVALSGGYSREDANARLARNPGVIASFSRALTEGLTAQQSDEEFDAMLDTSIRQHLRSVDHLGSGVSRERAAARLLDRGLDTLALAAGDHGLGDDFGAAGGATRSGRTDGGHGRPP